MLTSGRRNSLELSDLAALLTIEMLFGLTLFGLVDAARSGKPSRQKPTALMRECATAGMRECATAGMRECANAGMRECANAGMRGARAAKILH